MKHTHEDKNNNIQNNEHHEHDEHHEHHEDHSHANAHEDGHHHGHAHHGHHHGHAHGDPSNIGWAVLLNVIITVSQVIGGLWSGSLALLSDAAHNFSDVIALVISYFANKLSKKPYSESKTFGYKRAEIIAAFINVVSIIVIAIFIFIEGLGRWGKAVEINGVVVMLLAGLSIAVNGGSVLLIAKESKGNINMRSAYVHLFSDMLTSIAVLISGAAVTYLKWYWLDSVLSIGIAIYLIVISVQMLLETLRVLMQFAPEDFDPQEMYNEIVKIDGIVGVHHMHAWELTDRECHFEAHIEFCKDIALSEVATKLDSVRMICSRKNFNHVTLEAEYAPAHDTEIIEKRC